MSTSAALYLKFKLNFLNICVFNLTNTYTTTKARLINPLQTQYSLLTQLQYFTNSCSTGSCVCLCFCITLFIAKGLKRWQCIAQIISKLVDVFCVHAPFLLSCSWPNTTDLISVISSGYYSVTWMTVQVFKCLYANNDLTSTTEL